VGVGVSANPVSHVVTVVLSRFKDVPEGDSFIFLF
jgi:hypothetical protein